MLHVDVFLPRTNQVIENTPLFKKTDQKVELFPELPEGTMEAVIAKVPTDFLYRIRIRDKDPYYELLEGMIMPTNFYLNTGEKYLEWQIFAEFCALDQQDYDFITRNWDSLNEEVERAYGKSLYEIIQEHTLDSVLDSMEEFTNKYSRSLEILATELLDRDYTSSEILDIVENLDPGLNYEAFLTEAVNMIYHLYSSNIDLPKHKHLAYSDEDHLYILDSNKWRKRS